MTIISNIDVIIFIQNTYLKVATSIQIVLFVIHSTLEICHPGQVYFQKNLPRPSIKQY